MDSSHPSGEVRELAAPGADHAGPSTATRRDHLPRSRAENRHDPSSGCSASSSSRRRSSASSCERQHRRQLDRRPRRCSFGSGRSRQARHAASPARPRRAADQRLRPAAARARRHRVGAAARAQFRHLEQVRRQRRPPARTLGQRHRQHQPDQRIAARAPAQHSLNPSIPFLFLPFPATSESLFPASSASAAPPHHDCATDATTGAATAQSRGLGHRPPSSPILVRQRLEGRLRPGTERSAASSIGAAPAAARASAAPAPAIRAGPGHHRIGRNSIRTAPPRSGLSRLDRLRRAAIPSAAARPDGVRAANGRQWAGLRGAPAHGSNPTDPHVRHQTSGQAASRRYRPARPAAGRPEPRPSRTTGSSSPACGDCCRTCACSRRRSHRQSPDARQREQPRRWLRLPPRTGSHCSPGSGAPARCHRAGLGCAWRQVRSSGSTGRSASTTAAGAASPADLAQQPQRTPAAPRTNTRAPPEDRRGTRSAPGCATGQRPAPQDRQRRPVRRSAVGLQRQAAATARLTIACASA